MRPLDLSRQLLLTFVTLLVLGLLFAGILSGIDFATAYLAEQASAPAREAGTDRPIPQG